MKVRCMNSVPLPGEPDHSGFVRSTVYCGWVGDIEQITGPCPRCSHAGMLAPVIDVPRPEAETV